MTNKWLIVVASMLFSCAVTSAPVPDWAVDSYREGYITGLGVGKLKANKKNAEKFRDRTAELMAKANLAKQYDIHVQSNTYASHGKNVEPKVRVDTVQTSITTALSNQIQHQLERWVDPDTGTLYLLIGVKIAE